MAEKHDYDIEAKAEKLTLPNETDSAEFIGDEGAVHSEAFVIGDRFAFSSSFIANVES
jgi:hypothetical protein